MEELEHSLFIVEFFNKIFGKPLASVLALLGVKVKDPAHLFPDYIVMCLIVMVVLMVVLGLAARKLSVVPSHRQTALEYLYEAVEGLLVDIVGEPGKKYLPMIATLAIFIFSCNLLGLFPGLMSPTSKLNVTLGCAVTVFIYYHWQGMKTQGVLKYMKHFVGPIPFLAPLMVPIELISHCSRPLSLSVRLFGNIFAEDLLIAVIASILPFLLPLPFMAVAIFTGIIQAFVFVLLACIYISGAVAHEEEYSE